MAERASPTSDPGDEHRRRAPASAASVRVVVVRALGDHREGWDDAVAADPDASVFVCGWWVDAFSDADTRIVLVTEADRVVGGIALRRRRWLGVTRYSALGEGVAAPDHVDVVARPEARRTVEWALTGFFADEPGLVAVRGLRPGSRLARCLGPSVRELPWSSAPYLPLDPATAPAPGSSRVANTVKRSRRRIAKSHGYDHRIIDRRSPTAEIERALDDLVRLHRIRWPEGSNFARTFAEFRPVIRAGVAAGSASVHEVVGDAGVYASMLVFDHRDRRSYYQSGRETARPFRGIGTALMADVVTDAHTRGHREFDFLRGREPYKLDWSELERPLVELIHGVGGPARLLGAGLVAAKRAKPLVRRVRDGGREVTQSALARVRSVR